MDYYYHKMEELMQDFEGTMKDYPLFSEMIDDIYQKDVVEINELLEKNDEFYLKKAIAKMEDLISFIKKMSTDITKEYEIFDKYAKEWEKTSFLSADSQTIDKINSQINKANNLIKSHDLSDIKEANKIMERILKDISKL